jgi:hypothetical protein
MAKDKSWIRRLATHLADRVKAIPREIYAHATDRVIPQGAAELGHVLHTGSAYLPYGPGQRGVETEQSKGGNDNQKRDEAQQQTEQAKSNDRGLEM